MTQTTLFSSGLQFAPFVISSGLLRISWNAVTSSEPGINSYKGEGLSCKVHVVKFEEKDLKIIVLETIPPVSQDHVQGKLVSSSDLKEKKFLALDFLCSKRNPLFSVNGTAVSLFQENHQMLDQLKIKINGSTPLIVTGLALAGSVASLFTLSLLHTIGSGTNLPLCITFGSPLIGDRNLQQAISRSSARNSCFLNVVSHNDPLPWLFITNHSSEAAASSPHASQTSNYMPFGAFLLCSDVGSACSENPDYTLELLMAMSSIQVQNQGFQSAEYGNIVENLYHKAICKDLTSQAENMNLSDSLLASISLQLWALGLSPHMQEQDRNVGLEKMKKLEENFATLRTPFDPTKTLNLVKKDMVQLEKYKKAARNQGIGYYDSYKNMESPWDKDVFGFQTTLTRYWENMVEELEIKPQKEGEEAAVLRKHWLHAGTNYRKMVEPLVIGQYYKEGGKDYVTKKRPKHFVKLEEWLREVNTTATTDSNSKSKQNVDSILTLDSCFWAHVEEALLSCKKLKVTQKEEARKKLVEFEEYVHGLLKNSEVSPEIFLPRSSYMRWWNEYQAIMGSSHNSTLASFMSNDRNRKDYEEGKYNFANNHLIQSPQQNHPLQREVKKCTIL